MANISEKVISVLAGNFNSRLSYLTTAQINRAKKAAAGRGHQRKIYVKASFSRL